MRKTVYLWKGRASDWRVERELRKKEIKKALSDTVWGVAFVPLAYGLVVLLSVY
jgi:hypothetical protein